MAEDNYRHIVRIANKDIAGTRTIAYGLAGIRGVGVNFGQAICNILHIDSKRRIGDLTEAETKRIEEVIVNPLKFGFPAWMLNRRRDRETGEDMMLNGNDLIFTQESDVRTMKKIRSYRGVRHMQNAPVRGQRTRSNFRANKGKVLGVKKPKTGKKQ